MVSRRVRRPGQPWGPTVRAAPAAVGGGDDGTCDNGTPNSAVCGTFATVPWYANDLGVRATLGAVASLDRAAGISRVDKPAAGRRQVKWRGGSLTWRGLAVWAFPCALNRFLAVHSGWSGSLVSGAGNYSFPPSA